MTDRAPGKRPAGRGAATGPAEPETVAHKQHRLFGRGRDTVRIEAFSDAVIAIAMTLLVLDIRLPVVPHGESLWAAIGSLWEQLFAYVLSFLVIGLNWLFHHRRFRAIVRYDAGLLWLNLVFLLFIALVPFPTSLLAEYAPDPDAIALYAGTVAVLGLLGAATWGYAYRAGLLSAVIDPPLFRYILVNNLITPGVFLVSIPVAYILQAAGGRHAATWAMWLWILSSVGAIVFGRIGGRVPASPTAERDVKD